jgi:ATP-dependent DNA helicase RecG
MSEHQNLEWKESWRDDYLRWICGFANAKGGTLVIGKTDRGTVVGVKQARKLLEELPNKVRDTLGIMVDVNLKRSKGHELVEIVVSPYPYPISYRGEYHYRSGATKQELKGAALDQFLLRKQGRHWDGVPVPQVAVKQLSRGAVDGFRARARESKRLAPEILRDPLPALIDKLHLLDGKYLKRAAVLLFHADPERICTGAYIKIGYFHNDADLLYQDEIHGDLFTQVDKAMDLLLTKYLRAGISYRGLQRVETFPVPEEALREALLNAVIHKDYGSNTPIQISVYPDRLMLWNSGELPDDWTVERLKRKHSSQPFNPDIANAFFRAGMIESWGRGIERIFQACRTNGSPLPEFRSEQSGLWADFAYAKPMAPVKTPVETPVQTRVETRVETPVETRVETPVETRVETPVETRVETPVETPAKTGDLILEFLRGRPEATLAEVGIAIGKSVSAIERASSKLVKEGKLRFVGPHKGGHWKVLP